MKDRARVAPNAELETREERDVAPALGRVRQRRGSRAVVERRCGRREQSLDSPRREVRELLFDGIEPHSLMFEQVTNGAEPRETLSGVTRGGALLNRPREQPALHVKAHLARSDVGLASEIRKGDAGRRRRTTHLAIVTAQNAIFKLPMAIKKVDTAIAEIIMATRKVQNATVSGVMAI
jgi:hypothetical protein